MKGDNFSHQKNNPIFWWFSNTKIPVGVSPREYSQLSLPCKKIASIIIDLKINKMCIIFNIKN